MNKPAKEIFLCLLLLFLLFPVSPVKAATIDAGTAGELNTAISGASAGDTINITADITLSGSYSNFTIDKQLIIEGNNHTLNANGANRAFNVNASGDLTVNDLTIINGHSNLEGGAIRVVGGILTINDSTLQNNDGDGGGALFIYNGASATITNSVFIGNFTPDKITACLLGRMGGAVFVNTASATITGSTFRGNHTGDAADCNANNTATWGGPGGAIYSYTGTVNITDSTFEGNYTGDGSIVIGTNSHGGDGGDGGAVYSVFGITTIARSTFSGNYTGIGKDGLTIDGRGGNGGAVAVAGYGAYLTRITNSTFSGNYTGTGGTNGSGGNGGAVWVNSDVHIAASTFSGNEVAASHTDGQGGAIFNQNSTLIIGGSVLTGSILGGIPTNDFRHTSAISTSRGYNIVTSGGSTVFTATGDQYGVDPSLGSLTDNGGLTETFLPADGSLAIDSIPSGTSITLGSLDYSLCPGTDQRGITRPQGLACDIGSVEAGTAEVACAITTPFSDGRINAYHYCAPFAVYLDGLGGIEVYHTSSPEYARGSLALITSASTLTEKLAEAKAAGLEISVLTENGNTVIARPDGWIKVEITGVYGMDFNASILSSGSSAIPAGAVVPYTLPSELPATGGHPPGSSVNWLVLGLLGVSIPTALMIRKRKPDQVN